MKKILTFTIITFIFILVIIFSSSMRISPTQQRLIISQYETNCTNIWVLPEKNYSVRSLWSIDGRGDLTKYKLNADKIKLNMNYSYLSEGKYEFCFTPQKEGNLSGIIYFYSEENMAEIGSWIDLNVKGKNLQETISLFSGKVIKDLDKEDIVNISLLTILLFLIAILFALIKIKS